MKIVAVEYLNTLPMIYGIRRVAHRALCDGLHLAIPSQCAKIAADGMCDIALVPVGALSSLPPYKIITDYCISATGEVDTVALLSNTELSKVTRIYRDTHSRTSVKLCELLCGELWKIAPEFVDGLPSELSEGEAMVAIGDKVFDLEDNYKYKIDLSSEWERLYSLPFVFAVWVALTPLGEQYSEKLNESLAYGVSHISDALPDDPPRPRFLRYLTESIEYGLSEKKLQSMELFLSKI